MKQDIYQEYKVGDLVEATHFVPHSGITRDLKCIKELAIILRKDHFPKYTVWLIESNHELMLKNSYLKDYGN